MTQFWGKGNLMFKTTRATTVHRPNRRFCEHRGSHREAEASYLLGSRWWWIVEVVLEEAEWSRCPVLGASRLQGRDLVPMCALHISMADLASVP